MPYPYTNDLGKNPPPKVSSPSQPHPWDTTPPNWKAKVLGSFPESPTAKALTQKALKDQLFGDKPGTLKFPNVVPVIFNGDFPTNPAANKYGKVDLSTLPDTGPEKHYTPVELEYLQKLLQSGMVSKQQLYNKLFPNPVKPDPILENLKAAYGEPFTTAVKPESKSFMGFTKQATTIGDENSLAVTMQFKIDGLEGCEDKTLYAKQLVSKDYVYGSYGKPAVEKIVDDMLRQIKLEIMNNIKKAK